MGNRRHTTIEIQNPLGLSAPARDEKVWRRVHRISSVTEQRNRCCYCRVPISIDEATADHRIPVARGGQTSRDNIKAACSGCNRAKGCLPEAGFKRRLHAPQPEDSLGIHLAHFRLRLFRRVELAERRIAKMVGMEAAE